MVTMYTTVQKRSTEQHHMVMGPKRLSAVLSTRVVPNLFTTSPHGFKESAKMLRTKRTVFRGVLIIVRQSDKPRRVILLHLVHDPNRPVPSLIGSAPDTTTARHFQGLRHA